MGSDSELESRRNAQKQSVEGTTSVEDLNGTAVHHNTVHSYTVPEAESVTVTSSNKKGPSEPNLPPEDDADDERSSGSFTERFFKFLVKTTPFARAVKMIFWGCLMGLLGAALFHFKRDFSLFNIDHIPSHVNCISFILIGYGALLALLHSCVVFAHRQPGLYQSNLLHWVTEFEEYLAAGLWVTFLLGVFANISVDSLTGDISKMTMSEYALNVYFLAQSEPISHVRFCCIGLVIIVLSAVKRHFMHKLALQFNYSNYCDRVEESLFIEGVLQSLHKARSAYKFRKRWKLFLNDGNSRSARGNNATIQASDFVNIIPSPQINLKEFAADTVSPSTSEARSPTFIEISPTSNNINNNNNTSNNNNNINYNNNTSNINVSSSNKPASPLPATGTGNANSTINSSVDKKRQFEEFSRLCNRTATQFDSLSGTDIRVEIQRESRRLAAQLFKWLSHPQRADINPADLESFIDKEEDLVRFLAILKRSQKGPVHLQTTSFSESDLRRAIHSALLERYGLAKSMETVEMALGRIDGILNFLLFVLLASLIERLFFSGAGGAASPILSITTIFLSASFFFKDVAKSTFESIIFLLIIHPFDIGDRVFIKLDTMDNKAGGDCTDNLLVVEMNLMSTVFERWDGVRIYVPNSVLATKPIYNIRRSGPTTDLLRMSFSHDTRVDQLDALRLKLLAFLRQNRQDFTEFHRINVNALDNCNRMDVTILIQHASNWQDLELQMARRTKMLSFLKFTIEELGIYYLPPVQRIELLSSESREAQRIKNIV